jgi:hypothetical protein
MTSFSWWGGVRLAKSRESFLVRVRRRSGLKSASVLCGNGDQRLRRALLQRTSIEILTMWITSFLIPSTYSRGY